MAALGIQGGCGRMRAVNPAAVTIHQGRHFDPVVGMIPIGDDRYTLLAKHEPGILPYIASAVYRKNSPDAAVVCCVEEVACGITVVGDMRPSLRIVHQGTVAGVYGRWHNVFRCPRCPIP